MTRKNTTIFVVRHGETEWNRGKIFRGTHDIPLNDNGREQAGTLAGVLPRIDVAYTSPLSRAAETARSALQGQTCPIQEHPGLIDFDYGEWTGKDDAAVAKTWPGEHACWTQTPQLAHPPGGDTLEEVSTRAMAALRGIVAACEGQTVALFAHRVVNKLLVMGMLGLSLDRFPFVRQDNCCVNEFVCVDDDFVMVRVNDTSHLRSLDVLQADF
ncbi:MAG: histidine phosphatase family protein [Lentisphaerae bacterium]|nr:histidine phosphatase family protein [Lentisphaerota bacterium]